MQKKIQFKATTARVTFVRATSYKDSKWHANWRSNANSRSNRERTSSTMSDNPITKE